MPKRTLAYSPPKSKRTKTVIGQSTLDKFFSSPGIHDAKGKGKAEAQDQTSPLDDRKYAEALAAEDGLNMATIRRLEVEWKVSMQPQSHEFIDADLAGSGCPSALRTDGIAGPSHRLATHSLSNTGSSPRDSLDTRLSTMSNLPHTSAAPTAYQPLSVDPLYFVPENEPLLYDTPTPYSFLSHTLATLSSTRSRILIINTLTNTFRVISRHHPSSLLPAVYLLSNSLSPPYMPVELGLGPSTIFNAIRQVSGLTSTALKRLYNATGDIGDVYFEAKSNLRTLIPHPPLLVPAVYDSLLKIAHSKGPGAIKQKQSIVEKLLVAAKGEEARFLVRTLSMNLRVGISRTSILTALARAMVLTPPTNLVVPIPPNSLYHAATEVMSELEAIPASQKQQNSPHVQARNQIHEKFGRSESLIKEIFVQHPNYDHIVTALLEAGLDGLADRVPLVVGIPLRPTLGSPTHSLGEIYDRLGDLPFAAEYKYDGQRAQIHCNKTSDDGIAVQIFSRHLENMTTKYPDVVALMHEIFASHSALHSFIIDSEIVAVDPADGTLKSFQELSNRARKDVQIHDVKVAVGIFAFDLMYLNGEILLRHPFRERRALLRERIPPLNSEQKSIARFNHVESCESEDGRESIEEFWSRAVESRCEGLMIKLLDSGEVQDSPTTKQEKVRRKQLPATYEPDKRTSAWLKLKKDYVTSLGDSLDLIPIGAWHGNGRKAQWWSPVLLALRDTDTGRLVAVCKCMSGFSDEFYKAMKERYSDNSDTCSQHNLWDIDAGGLRPQVYFKPSEVWEIRGADVTLSPVSVAALGLISDSRGLSLRFPRFVKVRADKTLEEASNPEFLAKIWQDQQGKAANSAGADDGDLVDVELVEEGDADSDW